MTTSERRHYFLTGGAGYIGGTVSRLLLRQGHGVTILDNLSHSRRSALPSGAQFVEADIADRAAVERTLRSTKFDGVLHFAALIEAGESMEQPGLYFRNNTTGTLSLLEAMHATGTDRLVFSSTAAVYGEPESTPIAEDFAVHPTNAYGESKLLSERMIQWFGSQHGMHYACLRYFNVAGAIAGYGEAHEPESHVIPLLLDVAMGRRESFRIFGTDYHTKDGTCIRDFVHVADLADAHLLAMNSLTSRAAAIYNLGNGMGFSVRDVVESVRRVTGHPIPVVEEARRPGDPAVLVASSALIGRELGWQPAQGDIDSIVATAWKWHQRLHGRLQNESDITREHIAAGR